MQALASFPTALAQLPKGGCAAGSKENGCVQMFGGQPVGFTRNESPEQKGAGTVPPGSWRTQHAPRNAPLVYGGIGTTSPAVGTGGVTLQSATPGVWGGVQG